MRRTSIVTFSALAAAGIFAAAVLAQPQSGQRRGGGGGGFNLEADWALVCFQLETEDELLPELRGAFRKAYDLRAEVIEAMRSGEIEREEIAEEMAVVREELTGSLEKILGTERMARLRELRSQRQGSWRRSNGGGNRGRNRR